MSAMNKETIELAYQIAAKIVARFGDTYLPIFERLNCELEIQNQNQHLKTLALKVAALYTLKTENGTQSVTQNGTQ